MLTPDSPFYDWFGLNNRLFLWLNGWRTPVLDALMVAASGLGHPRMYPVYIAIALWVAWRKPRLLPMRNPVVFAFGYALVSVVIVPLAKAMLDFPRPSTVLGERAIVLDGADPLHAFPSGHAAFAVLAASALAPGAPRSVRIALITVAIVVCVSRVSLGAHFPADVVGGAAIGALAVAMLRRVFRAPASRTGVTT